MPKKPIVFPPGQEPKEPEHNSFKSQAKKQAKKKPADSKERSAMDAAAEGKERMPPADSKERHPELEGKVVPGEDVPHGYIRGSYKFTEEMQELFCQEFAISGRKTHAAKAIGISYNVIMRYEKSDRTFKDRLKVAAQEYRDHIAQEVHRRAVVGWQEPIIGGKDRDQVVCTVTKYSDRLLEMEAKRVDPSYREKSTVDVNHTGGVLVLGAAQATADDWMAKHGEKQIIDVTPEDG